MVLRCFLLHAIKQKLFTESFSDNSNLDGSGISLPAFLFRFNLKLDDVPVTLNLDKKVITDLNSSKAFGLGCVPVVILKNCEPGLPYIPAEVFNMCLNKSCFSDCWKISSVVPVLKNFGKRSQVKNYDSVSLLSVVS